MLLPPRTPAELQPVVKLTVHLCATGLAVGLGIGAIAEVAKQSLGGKQKGGMNIACTLPATVVWKMRNVSFIVTVVVHCCCAHCASAV